MSAGGARLRPERWDTALHEHRATGKILLAEPDANARKFIEELLRPHFDVHSVADGAAALAAARREAPSLIVTDAKLSGLDGFALLHEIRTDDQIETTPVILVSSEASEDAVIAGILAGADDYLVKPVSIEELIARIRARLMMAELRGQARRKSEAEAVNEREARSRAEEANRLKDEFIATLSHELRTPLSAIVGWSAVLRGERGEDPAMVQKALEVIDRSARAQVQIIEDILDVSRVLTGKMTISPAPNDLGAIVREAVDSVQQAAAAKGIEITMTVDGPTFVICDAGRMRQVASNLLSNAVRYTEECGGRIDVLVRSIQGSMEIVVSDNGKGIDGAFLPHVWERFRQADGSTSRSKCGLGLGLAIVRHIVEMHGGTAVAESKGLGRGATFAVRIPIAIPIPSSDRGSTPPESDTILANPGKRAAALRGKKILLVDDEPDSRELLSAILELAGAVPVTAPSAIEALRMVEQEHPDVVVSDIGMPCYDGYWFIRELRRTVDAAKVPAVALTAYARGEDVDKAIDAGFQHHVAKPVEPDDLLSVLVQVIEGGSEPHES